MHSDSKADLECHNADLNERCGERSSWSISLMHPVGAVNCNHSGLPLGRCTPLHTEFRSLIIQKKGL